MAGTEPISQSQWDLVRDYMCELYITKGMTLSQVRNELRNQYAFNASEMQYKKQISKWGLRKNAGRKSMRRITSHKRGGEPGSASIGADLSDATEQEPSVIPVITDVPGQMYPVQAPTQEILRSNSPGTDTERVRPSERSTSPSLLIDSRGGAPSTSRSIMGSSRAAPIMSGMLNRFSTGARISCPVKTCNREFVYRGNCEVHIEKVHPAFTSQNPNWRDKLQAKTHGQLSSHTLPQTPMVSVDTSDRVEEHRDLNIASAVENSTPVSQHRVFGPYQYGALPSRKHIRLLELRQTVEQHEASCDLRVYDIEKVPAFQALSYVWADRRSGHDPKRSDMHLRISQTLKLASSLADAVSAMHGSHFFWIDDICIDQENASERLSQIFLIEKIYQRATSVIVCLYGTSYVTSAATRFIKQMQDLVAIEEFMTSAQPKAESQAFAQLLEHPWFHRTWSLQEIVVNRKVVMAMDGKFIAFAQLLQAFDVYKSRLVADQNFVLEPAPTMIRPIAFTILHYAQEMKLTSADLTFRRRWHLDDLVRLCACFSACDVRDQIQVSVILSSRSLRDDLQALTSRSQRIVLLYFAHLYTQQCKSLDIVFLPLAPSDAEHPTWLRPRNESRSMVSSLCPSDRLNTLCFSSAFKSIYAAAGDTKAIARIEDTRLFARGFCLTTITECGDLAIEACIPHNWLAMAGWKRDTPLSAALWTTLVADRFGESRQPPLFWQNMLDVLFKAGADQAWIDLRPQIVQSSGLSRLAAPMLREVRRTIWSCRLAKTSMDTISLVPAQTRPGDSIIILYGCSVPGVVRQVGAHYEMLGECFLYGMMDGDALQYCAEHAIPEEEFEIW